MLKKNKKTKKYFYDDIYDIYDDYIYLLIFKNIFKYQKYFYFSILLIKK